MAIEKIDIKNFTVFEDVEIEFSEGINVFIGENGTGKTHLLKLLYADCCDSYSDTAGFEYYVMHGYLKEYFGADVKTGNADCETVGSCKKTVFIPAKEMLTHSKGLIEMSKKYSKEMPFDKTLLDIIEKSKQWKLDEIPEIAKNIIPMLENIIGGIVLVENDTFYVQKENGKKIEFSVEAEGIKKIGLLWQLLMNESITKDTVLLWDEPEANINPKIIPDLVEILLELSRQGVQIFVATHDYIFAKYFEVKMSEIDNVKFHALYKTDEGVKCETQDKFIALENNSIMQESILLYKAEVRKVME